MFQVIETYASLALSILIIIVPLCLISIPILAVVAYLIRFIYDMIAEIWNE